MHVDLCRDLVDAVENELGYDMGELTSCGHQEMVDDEKALTVFHQAQVKYGDDYPYTHKVITCCSRTADA